MHTEWLRGWKLLQIPSRQRPYDLYPEECNEMIEVGLRLFRFDALPDFKGMETKIDKIHWDGTSGNFALRIPGISYDLAAFVVTGRGAHKGELGQDDFVIVYRVDWVRRIVYYSCVGDRQPSTDSLLVARAFEANPLLAAWAHFHFALDTPYEVLIPYPAVKQSDWIEFERLATDAADDTIIINLIDHDSVRKGGPNGEVDSAIILGENARWVFDLSVGLVRAVLG